MVEEYVGRKFKTEFAERKPLDCLQAGLMLAASKKLAKVGFLHGIPGNFSVRTRRGFLVTAGGVSKEKLSEKDLVEVLDYDLKANTVNVIGLNEPSSEARMHWLIYKKFPKVNAIVHVHDPAILENSWKARKKKIVFTEKEYPYGTLELAGQAVKALKKSNYIVLVNHGSIAVGKTLDSAVNLAVSTHNRLMV
ncbi:MAG: class II aldolase/adducin family protein [Candidatus Altiarchaeales archaeon]|nr:class II aldolase/adducin family protein [Candidatus Altiarchaeales archaeon]